MRVYSVLTILALVFVLYSIQLTSAGFISLNLTYPSNASTSMDYNQTYNSSVWATIGLKNITLFNNNSGTWTNKSTLSYSFNNSTNIVTSDSGWSGGSVAIKNGVQFITKDKVVRLNSVTKASTDTSTVAFVSTTECGTTNSSTFSGDVATFSPPLVLQPRTTYYACAGNATHTRQSKSITYNVTSNAFDFVSGASNSTDCTPKNATICSIVSINAGTVDYFVNASNYEPLVNSSIWSVRVCDQDNNCTFFSSNYTLYKSPITINTTSYNSSTYETASESYSISASVSSSLSVTYIIGTFYYNGTAYPSTGSTSGNNFNLTNTLDIPIGSTGNKDFYWNIELILSNGTSMFINSSTYTQAVSALSLTSCTSTTNLTYNFTSALETNLTAITPFNFYSTIEYWIGSGTTKKNLSINNASVNYAGLCINPTGSYRINANIEYGKSGYVSRNYYLTNASATTSVMNVTLYLLDTTTATGFIINLKGSDGLPIENAYIYFNKYYAGLGSTKTVAMAKTDESGSSVVYLEADVTDYQIIVVEDGEVTYTSPIQKVYCSSTPCTLDIQTSGSGISSWSPIGNFSDLTYTMTFNTTDDVVSYSYVDTTGATSYARLFVYTINPANGTSTICNTYSNSSASTLTCDTTGYTGVIYSEGYISRSPEVLVWAESFVRDTIKDVMGTGGLFWALIIIMALSIGGAVVGSVTGGIIGAVIGLIFMPFLGVASFGMVTIWGVIIIGVFIIWRVKN